MSDCFFTQEGVNCFFLVFVIIDVIDMVLESFDRVQVLKGLLLERCILMQNASLESQDGRFCLGHPRK